MPPDGRPGTTDTICCAFLPRPFSPNATSTIAPLSLIHISGACPACLFPAEARTWAEVAERDQAELGTLQSIGYEFSPQATSLRRKVEEARARLDELNESGRIHKCPLTLTEMS